MKHITKLGLMLSLLIATLQSASAADCITPNPDTVPSTPTNDFAMNDNGTVIHRKTGLMWMRCPLSYELDSSKGSDTCMLADVKEHNWQEALLAAESADYGHYSDWRLPNRNELESIVELACSEPSINIGLFPSLDSSLPSPHDAPFWSSSPVDDVGDKAWAVIFTDGTVQEREKSNGYLVRLVRDFKTN